MQEISSKKSIRLEMTSVGIEIHWELSKKLKFHLRNKWYIHNPEYVRENETHKILWDYKIQTDHLVPSRQPDPIYSQQTKKKKKKKKKKKRTC